MASSRTRTRRLRRISLVLVVVACGSFAGTDGRGADHVRNQLTVTVHRAEFRLDLSDSNGRVTSLGGLKTPFVYWTTDGVRHELTRLTRTDAAGPVTAYTVATDEEGRTATVVVRRLAGMVEIHYSLDDPATVGELGFALAASRADHFLGTGERTRWVDMSRTVVPLKVRNQCGSSAPSAFFVSTAGFGAWSPTSASGRLAFPGAVDDPTFACDLGGFPCPVGPPSNAVRFCFKAARATVIVATGSPSGLLTMHARATGLPRAPWLPQLALIKWRDRVNGAQDLFDDITQLRLRRIPIGWVLLDNPWEQGSELSDCYGSLTFDRARFPNPRALIARVHRLGVRFMLWISPQVNRSPYCPPAGYPDGWLTGNDKTGVWDLTLPAAAAAYTQRLSALVNLGVDGFKGDRGDEVNLEPDQLAGGSGIDLQNRYPLLYAQAAERALSARRGPRFATLFRSFVPGSSKIIPGFVGPDAEQDYDGLEGDIRAAQTAGISGAPIWGSDIGGYDGDGPLTSTLFVRWAQFAALTPIFEVGGAGRNATFWRMGEGAVNGFRDAATLHYELIPLLYALGLSASTTGLPVVRPLGLGWPDDPRAWAHDLEFTVGTDLLAAPVTDPGSSSDVYLPAGEWVDVFTGARTAGGRTIVRRDGPDDFPLYLRAGSAVPFAFRSPRLWAHDWRPDDLLRPGRQGWLVAAGPTATARSVADRGAVMTLRTSRPGVVDLTVTHPLRQEQLLVYAGRPTCSVGLHGRPLPPVRLERLPSVGSGWARLEHATVVKVTHGASPLDLSLDPCSPGH